MSIWYYLDDSYLGITLIIILACILSIIFFFILSQFPNGISINQHGLENFAAFVVCIFLLIFYMQW